MLTLEQKGKNFITEASRKHNNYYDYSQAVFLSTKHKVTILCPEHGPFEQTPEKHISRGQGCPICGKDKTKPRMGTEEFIRRSRLVHGDKYDYTNTV